MKLTAGSPDSLLEWTALKFNLAPVPLLDTQARFIAARAIMVATKHGIFEALSGAPIEADEVARKCETHVTATRPLLNSLVGLGYVRFKDGKYQNTAVAQKWLTKGSENSIVDKMLFHFTEWRWIERLDSFTKSGEAVDMHSKMQPTEWVEYEDAMLSMSKSCASEIGKRLPVPKGSKRMLDIGGSHGHYSKAICDRHLGLKSVILELQKALENLNRSNRKLNDPRFEFIAGNVLESELGENRFDFVLMSNVAHHLSPDENQTVCRKVWRALSPGGVFSIMEFDRQDIPSPSNAVGALTNLYFALTSTSGTWSVAEIRAWQKDAGFKSMKTTRFVSLPGFVAVSGSKIR